MLYFTLLLFICAVTANEEYKGYKVYRVKLDNQIQHENLNQLKSDIIDYWLRPSFKHAVVGLAMVPPSHFNWFEEQLAELDITKDVYIEDVYEYLSKEFSRMDRKKRSSDDTEHQFNIYRYHRYNDILNYLRLLSEQYNTPKSRIELIEYGVTHENRTLVYLKVTSVNTAVPTVLKPVVVIEAAIIPRDWITIPSVLHVVEKLLAEQIYLQEFDWIVLPVVNPDGYEYSHTNLRLWTKSRSTKSSLGHICPGVNINRNFDVDWLNFDSSSSPCSHIYGGIESVSEIETQMIQSIINEYGTRIRLYLSLQNNGGFITYPWSYERAASGMFRQHHLLGMEMAEAAVETYKLDVSSTVFDRASGTSSDYARSKDILYTYNIDVVQKDGVIIPEDDIKDIVEDVWHIVAAAVSGLTTVNNN